jgi:hypothetical protein
MLFQQAQPSAHNIARRAVSACLNLIVDEAGKMVADRDGRIARHSHIPFVAIQNIPRSNT